MRLQYLINALWHKLRMQTPVNQGTASQKASLVNAAKSTSFFSVVSSSKPLEHTAKYRENQLHHFLTHAMQLFDSLSSDASAIKLPSPWSMLLVCSNIKRAAGMHSTPSYFSGQLAWHCQTVMPHLHCSYFIVLLAHANSLSVQEVHNQIALSQHNEVTQASLLCAQHG